MISFRTTASALLLLTGAACLLLAARTPSAKRTSQLPLPEPPAQKIQVAILLDVSNSMDGLIDQAKAQLWNMVNTLGRVQCGTGKPPRIEIALYEYGTPRNAAEGGYIRQINRFITQLDSLSENLFALTTYGGDEYCGHVIYRSVNELNWDPNPDSYKVIFIAGNESFRQGSISFTRACESARSKGIVVNTIYCGDRQQGIREFWNLQGECGNGTYTHINQDVRLEDLPTPYDETIYRLNQRLNGTYIPYGSHGQRYFSKQEEQDKANAGMSRKAAIQRAEAKSNAGVYNNAGWDLVDRAQEGDAVYKEIDFSTLPDSLQRKSKEELKRIVEQKRRERLTLQTEIVRINQQRSQYLREQAARGSQPQVTTLETEIEKILREQLGRYKMRIN